MAYTQYSIHEEEKIFYKVIDYDSVMLLCCFFDNLKQDDNDVVTCKVYCNGDDSYTSYNCKELFETNLSIKSKKIKTVQFSYHNKEKKRDIELDLSHYTGEFYLYLPYYHNKTFFRNFFSISGEDQIWVSGQFNQVLSIIKTFKNQNKIIHEHKIKILVMLSIIIGFMLLLLIVYVDNAIPLLPSRESPQNNLISNIRPFEWIGFLTFFAMLGIYPAFYFQKN